MVYVFFILTVVVRKVNNITEAAAEGHISQLLIDAPRAEGGPLNKVSIFNTDK